MTSIARDIVQPRDTIVSLASRLLGDPLRWGELVTLNKLRPPYVAQQGATGVLSPGDSILYPAQAAVPVPRTQAELEVETYGRDLAAEDGDLVLTGGDFATTSGLPNLRAALLTRISQRLGSHPFHPSYGSRLKDHLGQPADDARVNVLLDDVLRAVQADPRVQDASGEAFWQADVLSVLLLVTPVPPGTPFELLIPLPTGAR